MRWTDDPTHQTSHGEFLAVALVAIFLAVCCLLYLT